MLLKHDCIRQTHITSAIAKCNIIFKTEDCTNQHLYYQMYSNISNLVCSLLFFIYYGKPWMFDQFPPMKLFMSATLGKLITLIQSFINVWKILLSTVTDWWRVVLKIPTFRLYWPRIANITQGLKFPNVPVQNLKEAPMSNIGKPLSPHQWDSSLYIVHVHFLWVFLIHGASLIVISVHRAFFKLRLVIGFRSYFWGLCDL